MLPTIAVDDIDNIWITGDTHFDHGNIIKYTHRPFLSAADRAVLDSLGGRWHDGSWKGPTEVKHKLDRDSVEAMNEALIFQINDAVPRNAKLIHVGDFAIGPKKGADPAAMASYARRCQEFRDRISCSWVGILWGNHDIPELLEDMFQWSGYSARVELPSYSAEIGLDNPICLVLSHYAHAVWDESHRGAFHAYGHTHTEIEEYADRVMEGRRSMDVGVDNAARLLGQYRPFRLWEVIAALQDRPGYGFNPNTPKFYRGPREEVSPG
jgi:calcineurin-like phosphoesterase family protein